MSHVPDTPTSRPKARSTGVLIGIVILIALGAIAFWQRDRMQGGQAAADTTRQLQAQMGDLEKQVGDLKKQVQDEGQRQSAQVADLQKQLSSEQGERKSLSDQLGALSARVEGLVKSNAAENTPAQEGATRRRRR